jgi:asparagine synthase (glutamine-hydrolysing)
VGADQAGHRNEGTFSMCGIAGWVDFGRDLTHERATAQAMTDTMAARGPDDGGLWLSPHAAIGHRRLAVIDVEGGRQPMVAESDTANGDTVLTYSGEVYNFRELRRELEGAGHRFRTASDTEVVLRAYVEWGVDMVEKLNGMFAFAIWDAAKQELVLVRDRLGIKPLYYFPLPDGVLFGSEPKAILANPLVERTVDAAGLATLLTGSMAPGEVPFKGMRDLRAGHYVRFSRAGLSEHCYWKLEARPHEDDFPTTVAKVRELLEDIVERQLVSDVPRCVLLSGGLDSSAVTALADRALAGDGAADELRTFAVDFEGYAEMFKADTMRETPDAPYVEKVVSHIGQAHRDIMLSTDDLFAAQTRAEVLGAWDLPYHLGDMDISLYLLFRAVRQDSTVALSGEGADELFGGYHWMHDQEAIAMPFFPWVAEALRAGAVAPFSLFDEGLIERLKLGEYMVSAYQDTMAEVPRLDGEEGHEARMREVTYLHISRWLRLLLDRKDRMSMAVGLEVRVPFCDHRLVEYAYNIPWAMKTFDGRPKAVLRKAVEDLLPADVVDRPKAPFPSTQDGQYDANLRTEMQRILDGDADPVLPLLNVDEATSAAAGPMQDPPTRYERLRLEGAVRTNMWLDGYEVDASAI